MPDLPENLFANPVWHALETKHSDFAIRAGDASRYPADVAPFAALAAPSADALRQLHSILIPGESVWIIGDRFPQPPELRFEATLKTLQMVLSENIQPPSPDIEILALSAAKAKEMVALTTLAFPGFFRKRTCDMGSYYGVRSAGELIAMGGERLMLEGFAEISGICTHPSHRGKGLAASLIWQLVRNHRRDGVVSWLHVSSQNRRAIELYLRLGFKEVREVTLHRISRNA